MLPKGIHSVNGFKKGNNPLILMHPYFYFNPNPNFYIEFLDRKQDDVTRWLLPKKEQWNDFAGEICRQMGAYIADYRKLAYVSAVQHKIRTHNGAIIIFEGYDRIDDTMDFLKRYRMHDTYLIETHKRGPGPYYGTWENVFDFLENFSGIPEVGGGNFNRKRRSLCLDILLDEMHDRQITYKVSDLTFEGNEVFVS